MEDRRGTNSQLPLPDLLRQSIYRRLAGYEDLNDAERLSQDPTPPPEEALSSLWARAAELVRQHGLYSNGMNSASGLLPPEEVSAIDRPRTKDG
jgi:hypothetical protein